MRNGESMEMEKREFEYGACKFIELYKIYIKL